MEGKPNRPGNFRGTEHDLEGIIAPVTANAVPTIKTRLKLNRANPSRHRPTQTVKHNHWYQFRTNA